MIVSENEKEMAAEQSSLLDNSRGYDDRQNMMNSDAIPGDIRGSLLRLNKCVSNESMPFQQPFNAHSYDSATHDRHSNLQEMVQNLQLDPFSEHIIFQFNRIQRKVNKLSTHWEQASIIGDLADIPVEAFKDVMNDVLCGFLIHRANINGVQSAMSDGPQDQDSNVFQQNIE